jgi:hypothetical protein
MRQPNRVDATMLWNEGCVKSRLDELTTLLIQKFVKEDLENFAMEHKRAFKSVPPYPYDSTQIRERF